MFSFCNDYDHDYHDDDDDDEGIEGMKGNLAHSRVSVITREVQYERCRARDDDDGCRNSRSVNYLRPTRQHTECQRVSQKRDFIIRHSCSSRSW